MKPMNPTAIRSRARQAGFTLIELMVALTIGLVIILGFTAAFVNMKVAFVSQDKLTQLQDNERLAMTILTSSLQGAGYFPVGAPPVQTRDGQLLATVDTTFGDMAAGQWLMGKAAGAGQSDSLSTRYAATGTDGLMDCIGTTVAAGSVRNVFYVNTATNTLGCKVSVNGGAWRTDASGNDFYPLITDVTGMDVKYGLDNDGDGSVETYLPPASVAAAQWNTVKAVRITLNFVNPNAGLNQSATIDWLQTINLMNNK